MLHLLTQLGTTVLGEIVKKMVTGGIAWAADRKRPEQDIIELKLGQIAEKNLPDMIPADQRQAVVTSLVDLVMPTFEQVVEFNPNTQRIKASIKRSSAKKSTFRAAMKKSSASGRSTSRSHATKKSTSRSRSTKKSVGRSHLAKNSKGRSH